MRIRYRRPSQVSQDPEEQRLGKHLQSYIYEAGGSFDATFKVQVETLAPSSRSSENGKKQVLEFVQKHQRRPSRHAKDETERRLGVKVRSYITPKKPTYDAKFKEQLDLLCPTNKYDKESRKAQMLEFVQIHRKRPSQTSSNPIERRMALTIGAYTSPSSPCFDPTFREKVLQILETSV